MGFALSEILRRAETWPEEAQRELEQLARDIEAEIGKGEYRPTESELAGIDRGLHDSANGKFASAEDVDKTLRKLRQ